MRGRGAGAPCFSLTLNFLELWPPGEGSGGGNAAFYLQKARMAFIEVHASKPVRQADIRVFLDPRRGGGVAQQSCAACF